MLKRLIFDLDNTIILWKEEYIDALKDTIKEYNIEIDYRFIDNVIEEQEKIRKVLNKQILLDDINKKCNLNLDMNFINDFFNKQKNLSPENDLELIELFKYLSSKYEIVLLTNYFKEVQMGRLEKLGILKYFKECYGCEEIILKPDKDAFIKAMNGRNNNECIMIGDNLEIDIKGAINAGIDVIRVDLKNKIKDDNIKTINKLTELKEML